MRNLTVYYENAQQLVKNISAKVGIYRYRSKSIQKIRSYKGFFLLSVSMKIGGYSYFMYMYDRNNHQTSQRLRGETFLLFGFLIIP